MQRFRKTQAGFTMIEIMVVVVIVAILAAIAVPIYIEYVRSARASEAKSVIGSIASASDMYYQTNGEWPSSVDDLEIEGQLEVKQSTKNKWQFELQLDDQGGTIVATSTEEMAGGAGLIITFNRETGKYIGYGTKGEE
jgi:prepilin-type N-terminal cleavage/methylation domain-containing protein